MRLFIYHPTKKSHEGATSDGVQIGQFAQPASEFRVDLHLIHCSGVSPPPDRRLASQHKPKYLKGLSALGWISKLVHEFVEVVIRDVIDQR